MRLMVRLPNCLTFLWPSCALTWALLPAMHARIRLMARCTEAPPAPGNCAAERVCWEWMVAATVGGGIDVTTRQDSYCRLPPRKLGCSCVKGSKCVAQSQV